MRKKINKLKAVSEYKFATREEKAIADILIEKFSVNIKKNIELEQNISNTHHLYPISKGGTEANINKRKMNARRHSHLHALFDNATPVEQIIGIVMLNSKVFTEEFKEKLLAEIEAFGDDAYKRNVFKS